MSISIFLGQIIGIYLFLTSIALLINQKTYKKVLDKIVQTPVYILFCGMLAFILGLILVVSHNIWISSWEIIVTIISWLMLLKGVWLLFFPTSIPNIITKHKIHVITCMKWFSWICLFIGAYLIYLTFFRLPVDFMVNF